MSKQALRILILIFAIVLLVLAFLPDRGDYPEETTPTLTQSREESSAPTGTLPEETTESPILESFEVTQAPTEAWTEEVTQPPVTEETTQPVTTEAPTLPQPPTEAPTLAPTEPQWPYTNDEYEDSTRPWYHMGTCKRLDRPIHVLTIYLDDDESHWDEDSYRFMEQSVSEGLQFMQNQAAQWGVDLEITRSHYRSDENLQMHYEGTIISDLYSSGTSGDILEQAAADVHCASEEELYRFVSDYEKQTQIVFLVLINKDGISYANPDTWCDGREEVEYCVLFRNYPGYVEDSRAASIAHETFHLFGAEDYYDPYGDTPRRKELAEQYYPDDIMLTTYTDISYNEVGDVTAYSVGWLQEPPEMVLNEEWWR